jgi:hypothetical protein
MEGDVRTVKGAATPSEAICDAIVAAVEGKE